MEPEDYLLHSQEPATATGPNPEPDATRP